MGHARLEDFDSQFVAWLSSTADHLWLKDELAETSLCAIILLTGLHGKFILLLNPQASLDAIHVRHLEVQYDQNEGFYLVVVRWIELFGQSSLDCIDGVSATGLTNIALFEAVKLPLDHDQLEGVVINDETLRFLTILHRPHGHYWLVRGIRIVTT